MDILDPSIVCCILFSSLYSSRLRRTSAVEVTTHQRSHLKHIRTNPSGAEHEGTLPAQPGLTHMLTRTFRCACM
jgi:hypothetical protein